MIKKITSHYDEATHQYLEEFEVDYAHEVQNLPQANPGSTVLVKETGETIVAANNGVWGGGSGGGECDWNTMKNKPFYEEITETNVDAWDAFKGSFSDGSYNVDYSAYGYTLPERPDIAFEDGATYRLYYFDDGAEKFVEETVSTDEYGSVILGPEDGVMDGTRFYIQIYTDPEYYDFYDIRCSVQIDMKNTRLVKIESSFKPIDQKFIVLTSPDGTKYNLSVADDGTLSAVATT